MEEVQEILSRMRAAGFSEKDCKVMSTLVESYSCVTGLVQSKEMTIGRLRAMLFGAKTEKASRVLDTKDEGAQKSDAGGTKEAVADKKKPKGHGQNGANKYTGATRVKCPHGGLHSGDDCPECQEGKVYTLQKPGLIIRVTGQAPLAATVYEVEKLRCNLCGEIFTADLPEGVGKDKYDARSASMIALLKYGSGLPFHRLQGLQGALGIPLPTSTQWDIVKSAAQRLAPIFTELICQAAQGQVVHNDDTTMKVLEYIGKRKEEPSDGSTRTGVFTSGIVSKLGKLRIALFFTGHKHAGENLQDVLRSRSAALGPPIQMCDALSRNTSPDFKAIVANCLVHGRRKFVDVAESFPDETRHVIETLGKVYKNEDLTKDLTPEQRQRFHWEKSRPLMMSLQSWMREKIQNKEVEPNSGLGDAISYMNKHWDKLTLFLTVPGAPLDNNLCERVLKRAILHRKNSLFYRSQKGADAGDLFMSLIHTCQLTKVNPFDYLTALQEHADVARTEPEQWMPWNYRAAFEETEG